MRVSHGGKNAYQANVYAKRRIVWARALFRCAGGNTVTTDAVLGNDAGSQHPQKKQQSREPCQQRSRIHESAGSLGHLDAGEGPKFPGLRISSGKGSPSAHTAPSAKYSFFQIGTVLLRVSMIQRQASKAAPRCAEATTMRTLVSPIPRRPRRCTRRTSRTLNFSSASCANFSISLIAIGL